MYFFFDLYFSFFFFILRSRFSPVYDATTEAVILHADNDDVVVSPAADSRVYDFYLAKAAAAVCAQTNEGNILFS